MPPLPRPFTTPHRRFFVSTLLLSRTWQNETLVELRKEAKARGLSTKGNKSTLIARIQEFEENSVTSTSPPTSAFRSASTKVVPPAQAASPGIPLVAQPRSSSTNSNFLPIRLPDLSRPPPNAPVQVPYLPDFWNSAQPKTAAPLEPELPKLHVVSGSATHYDGGPTYNLEQYQEDDSPSPATQPDDLPASRKTGFWADFWESLGFPRSFSPCRPLSNSTTHAGKDDKFQSHSRPLTNEERKGLYVLLGIVGGSWLAGGLVNRPTAVAKELGH